jgi:PHB de-polymerase C-terminus
LLKGGFEFSPGCDRDLIRPVGEAKQSESPADWSASRRIRCRRLLGRLSHLRELMNDSVAHHLRHQIVLKRSLAPASLDLTAEFLLQTIDTVFVKQALPKGEMKHAIPVNVAAIRRVGLLTVEGENDDISGIGKPLPGRTSAKPFPT